MRTATEKIRQLVNKTLDAQQVVLDNASGLKSLRLDIKINTKTGQPRVCVFVPEMEVAGRGDHRGVT